jgi:hypothetical protein
MEELEKRLQQQFREIQDLQSLMVELQQQNKDQANQHKKEISALKSKVRDLSSLDDSRQRKLEKRVREIGKEVKALHRKIEKEAESLDLTTMTSIAALKREFDSKFKG